MLSKNTIFGFLVFPLFAFGLLLSLPAITLAETIYVSTDGDDEDDGTGDQPFKTLSKAAEEVNDGEADEIKIGKGSFSGNVTFTQGVTIVGSGKGSTTITGPLTFKKKAEIKNVSIRTKSKNAVTLSKNTEATLKSVDIRDYSAIGIWKGGGGVLTVIDSRIGGGGGKAIYVEPGTKLNISGNTITNNKEEGIDIRQNTRGIIKNNAIENNSESGMEIIVGSSDLVISGNDIKNNGASGIAFQFYESYKKFGTINATGNTISGNDKHGIDCNKPQKGDTPVGYWADSITLDGNTLSGQKSNISVICRLIEAKTEEEEKALAEEVVKEEKSDTEEQSETEALDSEAEEQMNQENKVTETVVESGEEVMPNEGYGVFMKFHGLKRKFLSYDIPPEAETSMSMARRFMTPRYIEQVFSLGTYSMRSGVPVWVSAQISKLETQVASIESISQETVRRISKFIYALFL